MNFKDIQLKVQPKESGLEDLIFVIMDLPYLCDSYWFQRDPLFIDVAYHQKVFKVLLKLLDQWANCVAGADELDILYLPFELGSQYTRCLCVEVSGKECNVAVGLLSYDGYAVNPSDISDYVRSSAKFGCETSQWSSCRDDFVAIVQLMIDSVVLQQEAA